MPAVGRRNRYEQERTDERTDELRAKILHDAHIQAAAVRRRFLRHDRLRDWDYRAFREADQRPHGEKHREGRRETGKERAKTEQNECGHQARLPLSALVVKVSAQKPGDRPSDKNQRRDQANLGIVKLEIVSNERRQVEESLSVEGSDPPLRA